MNIIKKLIKKILALPYQKLLPKIVRDLRIEEHERLLHHIILKVESIEKHQEHFHDQITATNLFLSGIAPNENLLYGNYDITTIETIELLNILKPKHTSEVLISQYLSNMQEFSFKDKSVCIVGEYSPLYETHVRKRGAKDVFSITFSSKAGEIQQKGKGISLFPTNLRSFNIPMHDVFLVPDDYVSSFLLKHNLFDLGAKTKEAWILRLNILHQTVFSNVLKPEFTIQNDKNKVLYNDNFIRYQLHQSGFSEVSALYTYGNGIDNYFDKKISRFHYQNGYYITRENSKKNRSRKRMNASYVRKIYCAKKLPSS